MLNYYFPSEINGELTLLWDAAQKHFGCHFFVPINTALEKGANATVATGKNSKLAMIYLYMQYPFEYN